MKIDRLLAFTRQPELLATDESQDLENLLQEYPYFSAGQLLLTVKYKQQNSSRFNRQLQRAAAHLPDKNVLAAALNEGLAQLQQLELEATAPLADGQTEAAILAPSPTPTVNFEAVEEVIEPNLEARSEDEGVASASSEILTEVPEEVVLEHAITKEELENKTEVSEQLPMAEVDHKSETEEKFLPELEITGPVTPEVETVTEEVKQAIPEPVSSIETAVSNMSGTEDPATNFLSESHDRLSWFRFFAGKPLREQPDDVLEELYLEHLSGDFLQAASATLPEIKSDLKAVINHEPEVASDKNLEEEIRRLAYESISDEELPASETLAAIYESQKDYKKALRIYQKLMLKFPDRMTYFAGLIESTKEKLNN